VPCIVCVGAASIDTPGVIQRVSELFRGHTELILGFNAFLPSGYKIEAVPDASPPPAPHAVHPTHSFASPSAPAPAYPPYPQQGYPRLSPPPTRPPVRSPGRAGFGAGGGPGIQGAMGGHAMPAQPRDHHTPPEFSHAINYVTKIKRRFANQPGVYKKFLEVLHTYQRQQRSIKDVLAQVRGGSVWPCILYGSAARGVRGCVSVAVGGLGMGPTQP
jgi:paired amphipathic helix protein Sin3a